MKRMTPEKAVDLVVAELKAYDEEVPLPGTPPTTAKMMRSAFVCGLACGIKLLALNDASSEGVVIPLTKAVVAVSQALMEESLLTRVGQVQ